MQRRLNDDDVYIIHPEKKHITHKVSSKNSGLRYGDKAQGHKNFASYVDHANKKHGAGHIAMTGRDINDQASYKHITEDVEMDQKYQAPFSFASDIAKDFAPKVLTEEKHDDGTPKSTGNAFDFKSFVAKKKEDAGENLRNHDKQKTTTGAVFKRKEDAKGADESDTKSAEKRGRGRPAGVYGSYKKRIKEAIEAHAMQIDELSKKTLGSYYNKASADSYDHSRKALDAFDAGDKDKDDYHFKKMNKRELGKMKSIARSPHTNESLTESHKIGDSVIVSTAQGDKSGKVNDITKTHVGVHHPGIRGIIHYHPDYVKKVVKEAADETLIEGVSWERWVKLNESGDKSDSGQWVISKHQSGYRYGHRDGVDHIKVHGTGKDAALAGSTWGKEQGIDQVYVLESFTPKNVKNDIAFGAIVNSALTTVRK